MSARDERLTLVRSGRLEGSFGFPNVELVLVYPAVDAEGFCPTTAIAGTMECRR